MKYGIVGSREFEDLELVDYYVGMLPDDAHVVSGGARGVDARAESAALARALHVTSYRPVETDRGPFIVERWEDGERIGMATNRIFGRFASAAFFRNGLIVADVEVELAAFQRNNSTGTQDSVDKARTAGLLVRLFSEES